MIQERMIDIRIIKNVDKHFLETQMAGVYETVDINLTTDQNGIEHKAFTDIEITTNDENVVTQRKMLVVGKTFTVCSFFPKVPTTTPTEKLVKILDF